MVNASLTLHVLLLAPAHHLTTEQVNNTRQVDPAFVGGNVGDVATPDSIGCLWIELTLHQVQHHWQVVFAIGGHNKFAFGLGKNAMLLHQATHPLFAHPDTPGKQFLVHAGPAVFLFDFGMNSTHVRQQRLVAVATR